VSVANKKAPANSARASLNNSSSRVGRNPAGVKAADILAKLSAVKKSGNGWQALCPAHNDRRASLSVADGEKGVVLHCHAGCLPEAICAKLGLTLADLFTDKPERNGGKRRIVATYPYTDESGKVLREVVRFEPKGFAQQAPDGKWKVEGIRHVPFRLPQLVAAVKAGRPVFIAEGERDVLALEAAGFCATCNDGGAGKWLPELARHFKGAEVVIIADKDKAGRDHAADVASKLQGTAASVKVIECPDVDGKAVKDAHDYFAAGGQAADLDQLAQDAPPWNGEADEPDNARPLSEFIRPENGDPCQLLKARYLCQGGGLLLCGPTGIGKSSLALQAAICWGIGREAFGIVPARPLKSLFIQAENDDGDMAEMRDGIVKGLDLTPGQSARATSNVLVLTEDSLAGLEFLTAVVGPALAKHHPDLVWIDPVLSYIGGEANSQRDVGAFLRNGLNPLLHRHNCGAVIVHHTNKPASGREKPDWRAGDLAYLGAGSAEWANLARAVLALRSMGEHEVFELCASKRGARIGWIDDDGERSYVRHLAHSTNGIVWRPARPDELPEVGRPKTRNADEVFALLPPEGLTATDWQAVAKSELGLSESSFHRVRRDLDSAKRVIRSEASGKWKPILKRRCVVEIPGGVKSAKECQNTSDSRGVKSATPFRGALTPDTPCETRTRETSDTSRE